MVVWLHNEIFSRDMARSSLKIKGNKDKGESWHRKCALMCISVY